MAESTHTRVKILLAVAGGGAVMALAGFAVGEGAPPPSPSVAAPVLPGPMTQGDTVTTTIPPTALATAKAAPVVKAKPYHG
ncbi:hypothetical protein ORI20_23685 [Mycobacterium sp. CVI_P3]|uniref:Alanine and proline-rich secreted protein Apa n=1 Tax=Mycobacterium pinniadriaticum TaxID=2994102 RepID=A0ABT3SJM6_9MYCO|nr:hypothetical protein [Mycobacterium pinniadriaticum]MCX2933279.1 hypothetical protein [Mycobacterium pinniadriaticum]MCX2939701.1 hypothetical protein [Mycobacterium pinniadriaticum]